MKTLPYLRKTFVLWAALRVISCAPEPTHESQRSQDDAVTLPEAAVALSAAATPSNGRAFPTSLRVMDAIGVHFHGAPNAAEVAVIKSAQIPQVRSGMKWTEVEGCGANSTSNVTIWSGYPARANDCCNLAYVQPQPGGWNWCAAPDDSLFDEAHPEKPWSFRARVAGLYEFSRVIAVRDRLHASGLAISWLIGTGADAEHPLYQKLCPATSTDQECGEAKLDGALVEPKGHVPYIPAYASNLGRKAFAKFYVQALAQVGTGEDVWQLWNEPNSAAYWAPKPDPKRMALLIQAIIAEMDAFAKATGNLQIYRERIVGLELYGVARAASTASSKLMHPYEYVARLSDTLQNSSSPAECNVTIWSGFPERQGYCCNKRYTVRQPGGWNWCASPDDTVYDPKQPDRDWSFMPHALVNDDVECNVSVWRGLPHRQGYCCNKLYVQPQPGGWNWCASPDDSLFDPTNPGKKWSFKAPTTLADRPDANCKATVWSGFPNRQGYCCNKIYDQPQPGGWSWCAAPNDSVYDPGNPNRLWSFKPKALTEPDLFAAISIHGYRFNYPGDPRSPDPEDQTSEYQLMKRLIARTFPGKGVALVDGEVGRTSLWFGEDGQAAWTIRHFLNNLANGIPLTNLYSFKRNLETLPDQYCSSARFFADPTRAGFDPEACYGLVTQSGSTYASTPAFVAVKTMNQVIGAMRFKKRLALPSDQQGVHVHAFANVDSGLAECNVTIWSGFPQRQGYCCNRAYVQPQPGGWNWCAAPNDSLFDSRHPDKPWTFMAKATSTTDAALVAWSKGGTRKAKLTFNANRSFDVLSATGEALGIVTTVAKTLSVDVGAMPVYLLPRSGSESLKPWIEEAAAKAPELRCDEIAYMALPAALLQKHDPTLREQCIP